jgi:hypothetical protein
MNSAADMVVEVVLMGRHFLQSSQVTGNQAKQV